MSRCLWACVHIFVSEYLSLSLSLPKSVALLLGNKVFDEYLIFIIIESHNGKHCSHLTLLSNFLSYKRENKNFIGFNNTSITLTPNMKVISIFTYQMITSVEILLIFLLF